MYKCISLHYKIGFPYAKPPNGELDKKRQIQI